MIKKFNLTQDYIDYTWTNNLYEIGFPQEILNILVDEAIWYVNSRNRSAKDIPNYINYIDLTPLKVAKPESVTIVGEGL